MYEIPKRDTNVLVGIVVITPDILPYFSPIIVVNKTIKDPTNPDKKMTMELGGKSPSIVFEDADLDSAVEGVVDAIWFNQGQVCCAGSRLLVQESIEKKFVQKLFLSFT